MYSFLWTACWKRCSRKKISYFLNYCVLFSSQRDHMFNWEKEVQLRNSPGQDELSVKQLWLTDQSCVFTICHVWFIRTAWNHKPDFYRRTTWSVWTFEAKTLACRSRWHIKGAIIMYIMIYIIFRYAPINILQTCLCSVYYFYCTKKRHFIVCGSKGLVAAQPKRILVQCGGESLYFSY